ncbi:MAG: Lrp/AsnC family transcriptional regulator [Deltaproteobacteria bacterium]|jgi:Lrp/AsnC family leucine-responsive transcriptional regulator|nr:Lrp/AsnC family transcriptional regulator [Deltaproteobacteria bacterium]
MIDEISLKILKILQKKARISNVEVARQVGLAPSAVLERIRKLEKQGIIEGYEVRLNPEFFDRGLVAYLTVKTSEFANESEIGKKLAYRPKVQEVHYVAGNDAFLVKVRGSNPAELDRLIREKIKSIDGVRSINTAIVFSTYKETSQIPIDEAG